MMRKKLTKRVSRQSISFLALAALALALTGALATPAFADGLAVVPPELAPDLVITNGKVITVDKDFSIAEAVAVKGDKIVAVGTNEEIKKLIGKNSRILDLKGAVMLPGINDSHCHVSGFGLERPPFTLDLNYPKVRSIADVKEAVKARVRELQPGKWVRGQGWDEGYLEECLKNPGVRRPTRWDLDPVSPNNPVCLTDFSHHAVWVNTKALELAGITKDTPNPPGGVIVRDQRGEPTGLLLERAADLVTSIIPAYTREERKEAIVAAMKELNSLGITSATDPGCGPELVSLYNELYNEGKLTVRMNLLRLWRSSNGPQSVEDLEAALKYVGTRTGFGNEWLRIAGVKILADGIPPLKTAWMYNPYIGGGTGGLEVKGDTDDERVEQLTNMILLAHKHRFQVGIHACGDRTIDVCMDAFEKAMKEDPWDARHYVIHGDFAREETIKRFAKYNLGFNVQAAIKWTIAEYMASIVGKDRAAYQWPIKSMLDAGCWVAQSSDASVTYPNWLLGIAGAVLRDSKATGKVWGEDQRITVADAIRGYTILGAYQDHMEDLKGSIEAGKLADFCVIDRDILTIDPRAIRDARVLMTIVGGRIVYNARPDYYPLNN